MSDYSQLLMEATSGQSPTAANNKYPNISQNRRNYLRNIVQQKFK